MSLHDSPLVDVSQEAFTPVFPSSVVDSWGNHNSTLYSQKFMLVGSIVDVIPPNDSKSRSKAQYEYVVSAIGEMNTHRQLYCICQDKFGADDEYEIFTMKKGQRVLVECIQGYGESGVIVGAVAKQDKKKISSSLGHFYEWRFSKFTKAIDKDGTYSLTQDSGPAVKVKRDSIVIQDNTGEQITIDQLKKTITIEDGSGNSIVINRLTGKITLSAKQMSLEATGNINLKTTVGTVSVDARTVYLNSSIAGGNVLTSLTNPSDIITGIPFLGNRTVKVG